MTSKLNTVKKNLNTVKEPVQRKRRAAPKTDVASNGDAKPYHHGDLREALVRASVDIIETEGLDGFSLREAARRAGVSAGAPAHHFGDVRGLLSAVATVGFRDFADELESIQGEDRQATIRALAHAYLRFAERRPGMFRLMWKTSAFYLTDENLYQAGLRAFRVLDKAVRGTATPELVGDLSLAPTIACWSLMHGFSALAIDKAFFADDPEESARLGVMFDAVLGNLSVLNKA
ncbi:TetR/AcrR family transcriptional regulator [Massilia sp. TN1-12]|uniref:TetR/AcrR family transcriptional regulator n=1 Tax=Massilia paldalensis TaxID=3377675 RepID=UPI00384C39CA